MAIASAPDRYSQKERSLFNLPPNFLLSFFQTPTPNFQQDSKNQSKIKIDKLRQFGLSDEQIAEALELPLEVVKQGDVEE